MECERFEEMLDRLFDETGSLTATDEMKEHMAECASCRNLYRLKEALLPMGECEEEELPEDIAGVLDSTIQAEPAACRYEKNAGNPSRWTRWASLAAAAVILVAGGTVLMRGIGDPKDTTNITTSVVYSEHASGDEKITGLTENASVMNKSSFPVTSATCAPTAKSLSSSHLPREDAEVPSFTLSGTGTEDAPIEDAPKEYFGEWMLMDSSRLLATDENYVMPAMTPETREECEESTDDSAITAWAEECGGQIDDTGMSSGYEDENVLYLLIPESKLDAFLEGLTEMGIEEENIKIDPHQNGVTEIEGIPYVKVQVYTAD